MATEPPYPLHASVVGRIDPDYAAFSEPHLKNQQQVHLRSVEASRTSGVLIPGAGPIQKVASTVDYSFPRKESKGPDVRVRCFTPEGTRPESGWPVCVYFHGGGWVLGTIDTENVIASHLCSRGKSVVVSVDYRYEVHLSSGITTFLSNTIPGWHRKTPSRQLSRIHGKQSSGSSARGKRGFIWTRPS